MVTISGLLTIWGFSTTILGVLIIFLVALTQTVDIEVGLSPSRFDGFIYVNEISLKMTKNSFYFTLKALFVIKIFKFLP